MATTDDELKNTTGAGVADFEVILKSISVKDAEGDSRPSIRCTASSTDIDLATDRFSLSALQQMKDQFPGMTIFLNHQYRVPEDVFGVVASAELVQRDGHTDLDLVVEVETANQRALDTYSMVKGGTTLGVSVGVLVMDADFVEDDSTKGVKVLEITDIKALEASIVGIPANRRSWVQGAMKAASALAAKGGPIKKLADGTILVPTADGTVVRMKGFEDATSTEEAKEAASETDPAVATDPAEGEPAAVTAANDDLAATSPDEAAPVVAVDDPEKEAAAKPKGDDDEDPEDADGEGKKPEKGKSANVILADFQAAAELLIKDFTTKSLTGEAAARELCDKMYSLIWSMYDALFKAFSADTTIDEKRGSLTMIIDEFSTVSKRLVENVIDDYFGEPDGDTDDNGTGGDRTMSFTKAFKTASVEKSTPAPSGIDATEVSKLMAQANTLIDTNRELTKSNTELEGEVTNQKGLVTGLFEAIDIMMSMPLARKLSDVIGENQQLAAYKEMFPYLDDRILNGLATRATKQAKDRK